MSAKNNCTFIGNLGRDAEQRFTGGGVAILSFSMPIVSGWGDKAKTSWVRCTIFGKKAESNLINFLKKGTSISVSGEISLNTYEKDGVEKSSLEMKVDDLALIGGKASQDASQQSGNNQQYQQQSGGNASQINDPFADQPDSNSSLVDDDIPF